MIEIAALIIGTVTTALIALIVFVKNRRSITSNLFIGLAIGLIGWSVTTYFSLHTSSNLQTLHWIRWIMFFVVIQNTFFFLLVQVFPDHHSDVFHHKMYIAAITYSVITALVAISPFLFIHFKDGSPQPGPGMALFIPHALIFAAGGIVALIIKYRRARGLKKVQLGYFLAGTLLMFTLEPIGNFVMPIVFKNNALITFSSLYAIVFSGLIAYAIVTKRLFDIRAAVARSVGYVLVIGTMIGIYAVGLFGIIDVIFGGIERETLRQVLSIILLAPLVVSFQYIKTFFDKVTNKLFYRESYDFQEVLDDIGGIVVAEIDLSRVLNGTRNVLSDALKASFIEFVLIRDGKPFFKTRNQLASHLTRLSEYLNARHRELLVTEELSTQNSLLQPLQLAQVALSLRLRTQHQVVGYILIGDKRSGDMYSLQDQRLLTIVASELAIAIQNALRFEEIQNFNLTLQQKVDEATRKLRAANERLRLLDATKDDFISMASHQLRTPLTSVKGYLSLVLDGDAGPIRQTQRKLLNQAFTSSQRMVFLIADLLNVSRLKTGKFIIESSVVNLGDLVEGEVNQLVETAASRSLQLLYHKPAHFPTIELDETKTRQVIMNFIDNAIYYTPAGGHIEVTLLETPKTIELRVTDDGIGVPKAAQYHLFTKFYRASNAQKARPDGTGLGLFMAKKVIVDQGGAIIFKSQEGHGSTFGFSMPKTKAVTAPTTTK